MNKSYKQYASIVLGLLAINSCLPAFAQTNIQNLPNGNYLFCDGSPPNDGVSIVTCFSFRKKGNQIIGSYYPTNVRQINMCVTGKIKNNTVYGEAYQHTPGNKERALELVSDFKGSKLKKWSDGGNGQLRLASSRLMNINIQGETNTLVGFRKAELSLNNFKRYRHSEGREAPKNCLDRF